MRKLNFKFFERKYDKIASWSLGGEGLKQKINISSKGKN